MSSCVIFIYNTLVTWHEDEKIYNKLLIANICVLFIGVYSYGWTGNGTPFIILDIFIKCKGSERLFDSDLHMQLYATVEG